MSSGSSPASEPSGAARAAVAAHSDEDVTTLVAGRLARARPGPLVDVGCGDGALRALLPAPWRSRWIGLDHSPARVGTAPRPAVVADAAELPVRTASVAAVTALWMLYELADPSTALAEAARVLVPGGVLLACTTRRDDSPELAGHFDNPSTTFDAEEAPERVSAHFDDIEVLRWDRPLVHLPDAAAVVTYLRGRGASDDAARDAAADLPAPLSITRRGSLVIGRRP